MKKGLVEKIVVELSNFALFIHPLPFTHKIAEDKRGKYHLVNTTFDGMIPSIKLKYLCWVLMSGAAMANTYQPVNLQNQMRHYEQAAKLEVPRNYQSLDSKLK